MPFGVVVSFFGLLVALLVASASTRPVDQDVPWRKPAVGTLFILICTAGGVAAVMPRLCSAVFDPRYRKVHLATSDGIRVKGHHPSCERFSGHILTVGEHTLCASCTGLLVGAVVAIFGAVAYFLLGWQGAGLSQYAVVAGAVGVGLGLAPLELRGAARSLLNVVFVMGAFLVLVGTDSLLQNLAVDLFILLLIVFWIMTRIALSSWRRFRICHDCGIACEPSQS